MLRLKPKEFPPRRQAAPYHLFRSHVPSRLCPKVLHIDTPFTLPLRGMTLRLRLRLSEGSEHRRYCMPYIVI